MHFEDKKGRHYLHFDGYESKCVVAYNGLNSEFKGVPKMVLRLGKSKFGNELICEFKINDLIQEYPVNSKHNGVEFYLPLNEELINALLSLAYIGVDALERRKTQ